MDRDALQQNMPVISSIISRAEDHIYNSTGLAVRLLVKEAEVNYSVGVDDLINKASKELCTIWGVNIYDVFEKKRKRELVAMRSIIFHYVRYRYPSISLTSIGNHFSFLDHTTIIHNINKVKSYIQSNDQLFHSYYQPIKHLYESKI